MKLQYLSPILWTKDLNETTAFYESVLGFKAVSNFPNFVSLTREQVEIMFVVPQNEVEQDRSSDEGAFFPKPHLTGSLYILTDNVDQLWEMVKDNAEIRSPICDREYFMRDFSIVDNNGYELVFGQDTGKSE